MKRITFDPATFWTLLDERVARLAADFAQTEETIMDVWRDLFWIANAEGLLQGRVEARAFNLLPGECNRRFRSTRTF